MRAAFRRHRWQLAAVGLVLIIIGVLFAYSGAWAVRVPAECSNPALNWECHYDTITNNQVWAPGKKHVIIGRLTINSGGNVTVTDSSVYIKKSLEGPNFNLHWDPGGITVRGSGRFTATIGTTFRSLEDELVVPSPGAVWPNRWLGIEVIDGAYISFQNAVIIGSINGVQLVRQNASQIIGGEIAYTASDNNGSNDQLEGDGLTLYTSAIVRNVTIHDNQRHGVVVQTTAWDNGSEISNNVIRDNGENGIYLSNMSPQNFRTTYAYILNNDISHNRHGIFVADTQTGYFTHRISISNNRIHDNDQLAMQLYPATTLGADNRLYNNGPTGASVIRLLAADIDQEMSVAKNYRWTNQSSVDGLAVYQVAGNIRVRSNGGTTLHTLTIDPGVIVKVNGNSYILGEQGKLVVAGSAAQPVLFTNITDSAATAGGDTQWAEPALNASQPWLGVWLGQQADYPASYSSVVTYGIFRQGYNGLHITNGFFRPVYHSVKYSTITDNVSDGIYFYAGGHKSSPSYIRAVIGAVGEGNSVMYNGGCGISAIANGAANSGILETTIAGNTISDNAQDGICFLNATLNAGGRINVTLSDNIIDHNGGYGLTVSNEMTLEGSAIVTGQRNMITNNGNDGIHVGRARVILPNGTISGNSGAYEAYNGVGGINNEMDLRNTFWGNNFGPYDSSNGGAELAHTCRANPSTVITDPLVSGTQRVLYTPWNGLVVPPLPVVANIDGQPMNPTPTVSVTPTINLTALPTTPIDYSDWQVRDKTTQQVVWNQTGTYCNQLFSRQVGVTLAENTVYQVRVGYRNRLATSAIWSDWYDFRTTGSEPATILTIGGQTAVADTWPPGQYPPDGTLVSWDLFPTTEENPLEFVGSVPGQSSAWFFAEFDSWNPSQPDAGKVSEWVESSSNELLQPFGDPDGDMFIDQSHWYSVRYVVPGYIESPYYYFSFSPTPPPWLKTTRGDIYARDTIAIEQGVPAGEANALYCVFSGGGSTSFVPASDPLFGECTTGAGATLAPLVFPRRESNYFSGTFGQLDINRAIARASIDCSLPTGSLEGSIRFCDTVAPLVIGGVNVQDSITRSGAGTLIVRGDIRITGDIVYDTFSGTRLDRMASLGIMALKRADGSGGNIFIDGSVGTVVGAYYAEGQIDTCASGNCAAQPLTVRGLFAASSFNFGRTFSDGITPAEDITYDGRALINVPPGMENFVKGLPRWKQ